MRFVLVILLVFSPMFAWAEGPRATAAAGLLQKGKGGFCSGVLIEADLVLTAAHCLFGKVDGRALEASDIVFRTGAYPGRIAEERRGIAFVRHPLFIIAKRAGQEETAFDLALVRLDEGVSDTVATPLQVRKANANKGDKFLLATWPRGRGERARERQCPLLAQDFDRLLVECVVVQGESGGPVLWREGDTFFLDAIMVATTKINDRPAGLAVRRLQDRIDAMMALLSAS